MIYTLLNTLRELIYQHNCAVCKSAILNEEIVCNECNPGHNLLPHSLLLKPPFCRYCGDGLANTEQEICYNCLYFQLPIGHIRSIWKYDAQAESLIRSYKYRHARSLSDFLTRIAWQSINSGIYPFENRYGWDLIIPIPSTDRNLQRRGFSPVGEIVKKLSTILNKPYSLLALNIRGEYPSQASLSPIERLKYIDKKFYASQRLVEKKQILLIDDVITSGASIIGATLALLSANAFSVDVLSFCRSDIFTQNRRVLHNNFMRISR